MNTRAVLQVVPRHKGSTPKAEFQQPTGCLVSSCSAIVSYKRELEKHRRTEAKLKQTVIRERALLRQRADLIEQKDILSKESDHRLLNSLQLIASLLSMQSRTINNPEAAAQLAIAANRVATIGRVHRHLHALDHSESVDFKQYLENLCRDLSGVLSTENPENVIAVKGIELNLPTAKGIPLGFIVSELVTNSTKYGKGKITVRLDASPGNGYALSVADDGPGLPAGFDPAAAKGLGMKIISSLVKSIGGQLQVARGDNSKGTRFTVLFS